ncbi:tetratricopeptide repeat protein [Pseudomonas sp. K1(2024)]|uniref:Tetratricopeptide repeat protein n=1 Tax=Pseudomonas boreofloridensis TaxID=3064348 RepID=A0ABV4Z2T2_9PSED|nr:tetratricopeptide repeat protein [Pseudomonas sp. K13]MDO7900653.1 tetratricopeptide repeat protein [Pseudomonas sp. K13]
MSELIKKRVVKDLIDELADLDATGLELVGHKVIETLEGQTLVHHGINKDYKPVGYTVDTFSQDFTIVGEYSTESGYFEDSSGRKKENRFDKIEKDIKHAIEKSGKNPPKRIYLVTSEEEPASFRGNFNKSKISEETRSSIHFLDARELAKSIFQSALDNSQAADFYRNYLPDFSQNLDRYEYYGRVPSTCAHHQTEQSFIDAMRQHFATGAEVCVLHGLSGSGKTQAAIDFVQAVLSEFGNYLWISGGDWPDDTSLTAIKRSRGGSAMNVAGVFNSTKTLLVIDDLNRAVAPNSFSDLQRGFDLGGRVLVTSQIGTPHSIIHLQLPLMSVATAFQILGENESTASETCKQFVESCRFCPLILSLTREVAKVDDIPSDDLYQEILQDPKTVHENDGGNVMERVLRRLSKENRQALQKIADSGCTTYDAQFLRAFIGINARASLQTLGILNRTAATATLTVHDLICRVSRSNSQPSHDLAQAIARYVDQKRGEMTPSVLRQIHLAGDQLQAAYDAGCDAQQAGWLTYSLLQLGNSSRTKLIPNLQAMALRPDIQIAELLCIVDAREAAAYELEKEARSAFYRNCAEDFGTLAQVTNDPDVRAEMLHHQGKALRRCGEIAAALTCFRELLSERPEWHATYGQIAHLGTQNDATADAKLEGDAAIRRLVADVERDLYAVPLRVSLAALSRLRSYSEVSDEIKANPDIVKQFGDVVTLSAIEGFDQFYEAFLALTALFGYRHGEACLAVAEIFPDMLAIYPNTVDPRQWVNACEALANVSIVAARSGNRGLANKLEHTMRAFAAELIRTSGSKPYIARVLAKTFLAIGDPSAALEAANRIETQKDHWLLYQKAKAELALGQSGPASITAKQAFDAAAVDSKGKARLAIYHDLMSQCQEACGSLPDALVCAEMARASVKDDKYGEQLDRRIAYLKRCLENTD